MADKNIKIAFILSAVDKFTQVYSRAMKGAESQAKQLEKASKAIGEVADKSLIAGGVLTAFFGKTVADARESVKATARLEQVFKSMGETSNSAAEKAAEFAGNLQFKIGVEDEEIMAVQAKLATFKRASDGAARDAGIFNRATAAAFDLQATNFGDALSNITQLGKALQNPALGATALAKAGAINKEDMPGIKYIQATKGIPAAQKFLLNAIEKQVKGVAERTADPLQKMKIQYTEVSESIGKALLPEVSKLADKLATYAPRIIAFVERHKRAIVIIAASGVALLAMGAALKIVSFLISGLSTGLKVFRALGLAIQFVGSSVATAARFLMANPIILIIAAIAAAAYLIYKNWDTIKEFFINLWEKVKNIFSAAWQWVKNLFLNYTPAGLVIKHWDKISAFFKGLWGKVKNVFSGAWQWVKGLLLNYTPGGLIIKHWDKISGYFKGLWDKVKNVFKGMWEWLKGLGKMFWDAGKNIVVSIWNGIKSMASKPVEMIKSIVGKIRRFLPFSPAKEGPLRDIHRIRLVETIAQSITAKPLLNAWSKTTGALYGQMNRPAPVFAGRGGGDFHVNLTIQLQGGASKTDGAMIGNELKKQLDKWWSEKQRQSDRVNF